MSDGNDVSWLWHDKYREMLSFSSVTNVPKRSGMTLVELLVAISIISILMGLLLPAVQAAREEARRIQCVNHLKQIGVAIANHDSTHGRFPSGGWGFQWVGDPDRGTGTGQPGGWLFSILPMLEAENVHQDARRSSGLTKNQRLGLMLQAAVPVLNCPARRGSELAPYLGQFPLHNAERPVLVFKSDFAGCGGDNVLTNGEGPNDGSAVALNLYQWPHGKASGVFFAGSSLRSRDITDGLSQTYLAAEKYVRIRPASGPADRDFGDDQAAYMGDDRDVRRWTEQLPWPDTNLDAPDNFGSRHPAVWNALLGDGSVHSLSFRIDLTLHRRLGNRHDGREALVPD